MVPEAAEAIDNGSMTTPKPRSQQKKVVTKARSTGLSVCQGCKESGACSIKVTTSSQEPDTSTSQALSSQNESWSGAQTLVSTRASRKAGSIIMVCTQNSRAFLCSGRATVSSTITTRAKAVTAHSSFMLSCVSHTWLVRSTRALSRKNAMMVACCHEL